MRSGCCLAYISASGFSWTSDSACSSGFSWPLLAAEMAASLADFWDWIYSSSSALAANLWSNSYLLTALRKSPMASGAWTNDFLTGRLSKAAIVSFGASVAFNFVARFALRRLFLTSSWERPTTPCSLVNYSPSYSNASPTAVIPSFGAKSLLILDWTSKLKDSCLTSSSAFYFSVASFDSVLPINFPMKPVSS